MDDPGIPGMPNWLALLKWSLNQSDGTKETSLEATKEDMEWLANAMADLVQDQPKRIREILAELVNFMENPLIDKNSLINDSDIDSDDNGNKKSINVNELLEEVRDMIDHIDMAQIFVKFGGIKCLMYFITSENIKITIRSLAAVILAEISQNNNNVQDETNKNNIIPELCTQCLNTNQFSFAAKLLFSISSIVRNNPEGEIIFRDSHMAQIFTKGIESDDIPLMRRTLFFINYFVSNSSSIQTQLDNCLVPNIFSLVHVNDVDIREETLKLLLTLATTQIEWKSKINMHKDLFQEAVNMRSNLIDINNEQDAFEKGLINEVLVAMNPNTTIFANNINNNIGQHHQVQEQQQQQQQQQQDTPILLIEPPGLTAAYQRP